MADLKLKSIVKVDCKLSSTFFIYWLEFLNPLWKAVPSMIKMGAELLKHRFILSQKITDNKILDTYLLENEAIKKDIMATCNLSYANYSVVLGKLRKSGFFKDRYQIDPRFIPKITVDDINAKQYNLLVHFVFQDEESGNISESSGETGNS